MSAAESKSAWIFFADDINEFLALQNSSTVSADLLALVGPLIQPTCESGCADQPQGKEASQHG
jgi:hypothetical protein